MWKRTCRWINVHSFKSMSWKTANVCGFEWPKRPCLGYLRGFRHFSNLQFFPFFGSAKSVLGLFFTFLAKIWPKSIYHITQTKSFQFDLFWPRDLRWPWLDTRSKKAKEGISKNSRRDPCHSIAQCSYLNSRRTKINNFWSSGPISSKKASFERA